MVRILFGNEQKDGAVSRPPQSRKFTFQEEGKKNDQKDTPNL